MIPASVVRLALVALASLLLGCASGTLYSPDLEALAPLEQGDHDLSAAAAQKMAPTPDLLALTEDMRDFADRYILTARTPSQRLHLLHSSLRSDALLGIDYDPEADGTAAQAFERGKANCLTYAHLFVSMARYAGLDARYQSHSLRPEWARYGTRVALRQHVNVLVRMPGKQRYMVDIDPVERHTIADTRLLSDEDAFALHYNNIAMISLRNDLVEDAYVHAIKAVSTSSTIDYLWVNLGTIYSRAGQSEAAQHSYLTAIELNPDSRSAMNNLMVLHNRQGNLKRAAFWEQQVSGHRERNPYYYIYLGEQAELAGDFQAAIGYYRAAIQRKDSDAEFYFRLGKLYIALEQPRRGVEYVRQAIERSRLVGEREEYQAFLNRVEGRSVAQLR